MREIVGFECEKCNTFYSTPDEAVRCENEHSNIDDIIISSINFSNLKGKYGVNYGFFKKVPESLHVRIHGIIVNYRLDSTMKGV